MRCPNCNVDNDKVIDSRASDEGRAIRRRRVCQECGRRFTTYEHIDDSPRLTVIKKDGSRTPFDRQKILNGVEKACYKRQVPAQAMIQLVDEVEEEIARTHEREVQSIDIGSAVAHRLKSLDQVAYVRFASVYKQFRDLDDLLKEVREVLDTGRSHSKEQGNLF